MYTKKDLEQKFNISDTTVYKTLQVCGLDTTKKEYLDEEIENFFVPARKMLEAGKKYKQVKEYFQMRSQGVEPQGEEELNFDADGFTANQAVDAADLVSLNVAQAVADMVEQSVKEVAPFIPALVVQSINRELNSGEIKEAFDRMRSQIRGNKGSGAAFLLQKMQQTPQLLMPSEPPAMSLPPSSMESSTTSSESES